MRNPQRINSILDVIGQIWKLYPDLRYHQLTTHLQNEFHKRTNNGTKREIYEYNDNTHSMELWGHYIDLFHIEDDLFYDFLCEYHKELKQQLGK